jgi:hypothetical protein
MEQKEIEDFALRMAGAFLGATEDIALEANYNANPTPGQFPYVAPLGPGFPAGDDLLVGGLSIPPWVIGMLAEEDGKKKSDTKMQETGKQVRKFGEGNVCYSIPMLIHHTLARQTNTASPGIMPTAAGVPGPTGGSPRGSPQGNQPGAGVVVKL